jgi:hypothetical protein
LLDECVPKALKHAISSAELTCLTVKKPAGQVKQMESCSTSPKSAFDVVVTLDTNLRYQQNLTGRRIAVVVLAARSNRLEDLSPLFPGCVEAVEKIMPGEIIYIGSPR